MDLFSAPQSSGYLAVMALVGMDALVMRPVALAINVLVATIAFVQFARAGYFSWALVWPFAAASIPGTPLDTHIVRGFGINCEIRSAVLDTMRCGLSEPRARGGSSQASAQRIAAAP